VRHQLGYHGRFGALELAVATGLQGANAGPAFNNVEESLIPTGSARVMMHLDARSVIGVSGIAAGLRFAKPDSPVQYRPAYGGELFGDLTFGPLNLHAEAYLAQNLANMGALNLGFGRYGADVVVFRSSRFQHTSLRPRDIVSGRPLHHAQLTFRIRFSALPCCVQTTPQRCIPSSQPDHLPTHTLESLGHRVVVRTRIR